MIPVNPPSKIQVEHLAKQAFIYVRQSSLKQVQRNTGSTARQYDLGQRAHDLGWQPNQIVVIDQDQAHSGASSTDRSGFQHLVAEVGLGHAGAVLSLEVSRLARSSSDWYRLLEICALTNTLVIDEEGVYDPGQYNDRLLLGFKGTMSEAELHWIRSRLLGGKLELARQGKLRLHPPTGLVHDMTGRLVKDPDEAIQVSIQQVFDRFNELRTARAVVTYFQTHGLLIPTRLWGTKHAGECVWRPLSHSRVLEILHNPFYAGTYVYGRTQRLKKFDGTLKTTVQHLDPAAWRIVIPNAHPGYITWEQFQRNQQRLDDNHYRRDRSRRGAIREGVGLLQGIVLCGRCGRRMKVRYQEDKTRPLYACDEGYNRYGEHWCQAIRGQHVDATIAQLILEAMQPAHIAVALTALDQLEQCAQQRDRQHQLQLERTHYEVDLSRRRFMAVDPENRLVARTLERDWNDKLSQLEALERAQASLPSNAIQGATKADRERIIQLVQDFPRLWHATTTTHAERKQLLRCLLHDVTLTGGETTIHIGIRWRTGATTTVEIPRGTLRTVPTIIDQIRQQAEAQQSDERIALALNGAGFTTARRHPFTAARVKELRLLYHIPRGDAKRPARYGSGQRADGRYTIRKTSELLNWSIATIHKWCRQGRLDSVQDGPNCPRWVKLTPEVIAELRNPDNPWDPNLL